MKSIIIHEFMIAELKLKGAELLFYALIYSFSQFHQSYFADDKVTCKFLNLSRAQLFRVRSSLLHQGLICNDGKGFYATNISFIADQNSENLAELVRIAKTPWVY